MRTLFIECCRRHAKKKTYKWIINEWKRFPFNDGLWLECKCTFSLRMHHIFKRNVATFYLKSGFYLMVVGGLDWGVMVRRRKEVWPMALIMVTLWSSLAKSVSWHLAIIISSYNKNTLTMSWTVRWRCWRWWGDGRKGRRRIWCQICNSLEILLRSELENYYRKKMNEWMVF